MIFNDKTQKLDRGLSTKDITIQVTGDCNLACTYCYLKHKNNHMLNVKNGKKFIDKLVSDDQTFWNGYLDFSRIEAINLQFIGGEPFCNYKAIIELVDYYAECCKRYNKPQLYNNTTFGICTNGTIYNEDIAEFLTRYKGKVDLSISIDGNKELHDTCRRFKGSNKPSYDIVIENLYKYRKLMPECHPINTKATISPENLNYIYDSVVNFYEVLGFNKVPMNTIHENQWTIEQSKVLYEQLKKVADFILEKGYKFDNFTIMRNDGSYKELGFFNQELFSYIHPNDRKHSWCGGSGKMVFLQYDGKIYNCNRYSETAIGNPERDLFIGHINTGITETDNIKLMQCACYETMYDEECKNCPIQKGCADCLAFCYEMQGEFKKIKNLCNAHKARCLANVYLWNKYYLSHNVDKVFLMNLPYEDAVKIVGEQETEMLLDLSNRRYMKLMENNNGCPTKY